MPIKTYKDLNVFAESYGLAFYVSRSTKRLPVYEQSKLADRDAGYLDEKESRELGDRFGLLDAMLKIL